MNEGLPVGSKCPTVILLLTCLPNDGSACLWGILEDTFKVTLDLIIPKKRTEDRLLNIDFYYCLLLKNT